jgi:hypothetical protein
MNEYIEIIDDIIYNIDSQPTQQLNISLEEYIKKELSKLKQELTKCDELKAKVKRYFELKNKGIIAGYEALEYIELLKQINEMVGIEE